jgi:hypothetical protein
MARKRVHLTSIEKLFPNPKNIFFNPNDPERLILIGEIPEAGIPEGSDLDRVSRYRRHLVNTWEKAPLKKQHIRKLVLHPPQALFAHEPPTAECEARVSKDKRNPHRSLVIPECPFCRMQHTHGGGKPEEPLSNFLGWRAPHCCTWINQSPTQYYLTVSERPPLTHTVTT